MAILTGDTLLPGDPAMGLAGRADHARRTKATQEYLARPEVMSDKASCEQGGGHFKVKVNRDGSIKSGCQYSGALPTADFSGRAGQARKRKAETEYSMRPEVQAAKAECAAAGGKFYVKAHPNGGMESGCRHSRERMIEMLYAEAKTGGAKSLAKYEQMKREFLANPALMSAVGLDASIFAEVDALLLKMKSNANTRKCSDVPCSQRAGTGCPPCGDPKDGLPTVTSPGGEESMPDYKPPADEPPYETRKEAKQEHLWIWGAMGALALFMVLRRK